MTARRNYQRLCDLLWLLTSLTICVASVRLKLGTLSNPGSGFFPFWTGIFLLFFSLIGLCKNLRDEEGTRSWAGPYWKRVIGILISLFGYALILTNLGYVLSTLLLMIFLFWTPEYRKWKPVIIKAMLSVGITYLVFNKWLDCQLPKGIFGF